MGKKDVVLFICQFFEFRFISRVVNESVIATATVTLSRIDSNMNRKPGEEEEESREEIEGVSIGNDIIFQDEAIYCGLEVIGDTAWLQERSRRHPFFSFLF